MLQVKTKGEICLLNWKKKQKREYFGIINHDYTASGLLVLHDFDFEKIL